jgi:hypothetical protein
MQQYWTKGGVSEVAKALAALMYDDIRIHRWDHAIARAVEDGLAHASPEALAAQGNGAPGRRAVGAFLYDALQRELVAAGHVSPDAHPVVALAAARDLFASMAQHLQGDTPALDGPSVGGILSSIDRTVRALMKK